jgi:hypothetical protein
VWMRLLLFHLRLWPDFDRWVFDNAPPLDIRP